MKVIKVLKYQRNTTIFHETEHALVLIKRWSWSKLEFVEEERKVFKNGMFWKWLDNGKYTPRFIMERAIEARIASIQLDQ